MDLANGPEPRSGLSRPFRYYRDTLRRRHSPESPHSPPREFSTRICCARVANAAQTWQHRVAQWRLARHCQALPDKARVHASGVWFRFVGRNQGFVLGLQNKGFCDLASSCTSCRKHALRLSSAASFESSSANIESTRRAARSNLPMTMSHGPVPPCLAVQ